MSSLFVNKSNVSLQSNGAWYGNEKLVEDIKSYLFSLLKLERRV